MEWILASASPRRKQLFAVLTDTFEILPAQGEEAVLAELSPKALAEALATQKAEEVCARIEERGVCKAILAADTVVAQGGVVYGKPKDETDAFQMLVALSGKSHEVHTGVCVLYPYQKDGKCAYIKLSETATTAVWFNRLDEAQIRKYIQSGSPMDKAGGYGIQDGDLVERIEGSFSNVVGLPLELCCRMMEQAKSLALKMGANRHTDSR